MDNIETVIDPEIEKRENVKRELIKSFGRYQKVMSLMAIDGPVSILGLPKNIQKILEDNGILRLYEILNMDLVKIEGLSDVDRTRLTSSLNKFSSML